MSAIFVHWNRPLLSCSDGVGFCTIIRRRRRSTIRVSQIDKAWLFLPSRAIPVGYLNVSFRLSNPTMSTSCSRYHSLMRMLNSFVPFVSQKQAQTARSRRISYGRNGVKNRKCGLGWLQRRLELVPSSWSRANKGTGEERTHLLSEREFHVWKALAPVGYP